MFDETYANHVKIAHGVLAALAWVVFFPAGAISLRLLSNRNTIRIHVTLQIIAYVLFIAAVGLGIHLVYYLEQAGADLFMSHHPIIGLLIFGLVFFQLVLGFVHHAFFKKTNRRTLWTQAHLWLGRIVITIAMINGGLGLLLASPYQSVRSGEIVYGVFAGLVWCAYVAAAVYGEVQRGRTTTTAELEKGVSSSEQSIAADGDVAAEKEEAETQ